MRIKLKRAIVNRKIECVAISKISVGDGDSERKMIPFGMAHGTEVIAIRDRAADAGEVEGVGALSREDGLALPCCNTSQANTTCFLQPTIGIP